MQSKMNKDGNPVAKGVESEAKQELVAEINSAIENERETQKNIEMHIANFQKKITEKRKNCLGMNSGAESENNLHKQIKILENRLDKANQKFNETTAHNKDLKGVIDSLRRERVIFDNLYKKLEKELHEKRKKMADIIEKANNAYEERDKAHNQIQTLKIQAKKEATDFEREIKEMSYLLEKIKLSSYSKKVGRSESPNQNFYETEPVILHEARNTKYLWLDSDSRKRTRSRWRRSRSSGRTLPKSRPPLRSKTSRNCCGSSPKTRRRTSRCSSSSTSRATTSKNSKPKSSNSRRNSSSPRRANTTIPPRTSLWASWSRT